jgi:hypothetical protein
MSHPDAWRARCRSAICSDSEDRFAMLIVTAAATRGQRREQKATMIVDRTNRMVALAPLPLRTRNYASDDSSSPALEALLCSKEEHAVSITFRLQLQEQVLHAWHHDVELLHIAITPGYRLRVAAWGILKISCKPLCVRKNVGRRGFMAIWKGRRKASGGFSHDVEALDSVRTDFAI